MKPSVKDLLQVYAESAKIALLTVFPNDEETIEKINVAFAKGEEITVDQLIAAFGSKDAMQALSDLNEDTHSYQQKTSVQYS